MCGNHYTSSIKVFQNVFLLLHARHIGISLLSLCHPNWTGDRQVSGLAPSLPIAVHCLVTANGM
jgi:hypothetical protein